MSNQYYKKDIHKSIEGLLYGFYVYQYLLDTSTFGLILRYIVQDQILSLKTKAPTLRVALYAVIATTFLSFLRHLHSPDRYSIIIDFIGNVSVPSRSKLLWLDVLITLLQVTNALVVFNLRKSGTNTRRPVTNVQGTPSGQPTDNASPCANTHRHGSAASAISTLSTSNPSSQPNTHHLGIHSDSRISRETPSASSSRTAEQSSSSQDPTQESSLLFEYTPQNDISDLSNSRGDPASQYYVDEEETRYSLDNPLHRDAEHRTVGQSRDNGSDSETDSGSSGDNSDDDDNDNGDPLEDGYEEVLEQETFVLQLQFKDMISYLFSNQEAFSISRISITPRNAAAEAEAMRVQNLPV
ncbi:hypothetical protein BGX27_008507 [Mortierella sp. AM989]|nr:hypothetical protein BGX27_008507 [Mortierella sp. AM989]